jgi:hypothetical protein
MAGGASHRRPRAAPSRRGAVPRPRRGLDRDRDRALPAPRHAALRRARRLGARARQRRCATLGRCPGRPPGLARSAPRMGAAPRGAGRCGKQGPRPTSPSCVCGVCPSRWLRRTARCRVRHAGPKPAGTGNRAPPDAAPRDVPNAAGGGRQPAGGDAAEARMPPEREPMFGADWLRPRQQGCDLRPGPRCGSPLRKRATAGVPKLGATTDPRLASVNVAINPMSSVFRGSRAPIRRRTAARRGPLPTRPRGCRRAGARRWQGRGPRWARR